MLNLTNAQQNFITEFTEGISTQEIIEDLMLIYSAYVDNVSDPEKFTVDKDTFLDIQAKLFTIQRLMELVSVIHDAAKPLKKVS